MLEHVKPVREAFDKLAGNPDMVKAYSQSWTNIGDHVTEVARDLKSAVAGETAKWEGVAANAYRVFAGVQTAQVASLAAASYGLAELTRAMGEIIGGVRTAVRDILSGIAGCAGVVVDRIGVHGRHGRACGHRAGDRQDREDGVGCVVAAGRAGQGRQEFRRHGGGDP